MGALLATANGLGCDREALGGLKDVLVAPLGRCCEVRAVILRFWHAQVYAESQFAWMRPADARLLQSFLNGAWAEEPGMIWCQPCHGLL